MKPIKKIEKVEVIRGKGRGKKQGIPTINLNPTVVRGLKKGIYVCKAYPYSNNQDQNPEAYWGVMHFGPRPVFKEKEISLEIHLFEFNRMVNSGSLDLEIYDFIRKVKNFRSVDAMVRVVANDIKIAHKLIASYQE